MKLKSFIIIFVGILLLIALIYADITQYIGAAAAGYIIGKIAKKAG